jgi:glycogen synthase
MALSQLQEKYEESLADDVRRDMSQATGFSFSTDKATDLTAALSRALDCLKHNHQAWTALIRNCMTKDWSWDATCVEAYEAAYQSILHV